MNDRSGALASSARTVRAAFAAAADGALGGRGTASSSAACPTRPHSLVGHLAVFNFNTHCLLCCGQDMTGVGSGLGCDECSPMRALDALHRAFAFRTSSRTFNTLSE